MDSRENQSLWFWLGYWDNYAGKGKKKWRFPQFLRKKTWRGEYFWKDTILVYFYRVLGCRCAGHKTINVYPNSDNSPALYCTECGAYPVREKVHKAPVEDMPLYINDSDLYVVTVATERLKAIHKNSL